MPTRLSHVTQTLTMLRLTCVCILSLLVGCTTTIRPPTDLQNPVTIALLDHGRHASLLLGPVSRDDPSTAPSTAPAATQRTRETEPADAPVLYAFGDWRYFALGEATFLRGVAAMLWPTPGTLGRKLLDPTIAIEDPAVGRYLGLGVEHIYLIQVERAEVAALRARLHEPFASQVDQWVVNPGYASVTYVPYQDRYSLLYNCNHAVAAWLTALGCEVRSVSIDSAWRLVD